MRAMVVTPESHGRLERVKFHSPTTSGSGDAPAKALGLRHVAFVIVDIDTAVATVRPRSGELVGEMENHQDIFQLGYLPRLGRNRRRPSGANWLRASEGAHSRLDCRSANGGRGKPAARRTSAE